MCLFSNFHVHENVNKPQRGTWCIKMLWFLFLEGECVFERLDRSVLQQTQGDDSQKGLNSCLWRSVALCSGIFHKQSTFLFSTSSLSSNLQPLEISSNIISQIIKLLQIKKTSRSWILNTVLITYSSLMFFFIGSLFL